jgi:hypothetical protein
MIFPVSNTVENDRACSSVGKAGESVLLTMKHRKRNEKIILNKGEEDNESPSN